MKKQHLFIGGKPTESVDYKTLQAPYSGETLAEVSSASAEEAEVAIARCSGWEGNAPDACTSACRYSVQVVLHARRTQGRSGANHSA